VDVSKAVLNVQKKYEMGKVKIRVDFFSSNVDKNESTEGVDPIFSFQTILKPKYR
jgi:hypothetical protein